MGSNEVCPAGRVFPLRCGGYPVAFENITDGLVGNLMAEIGQGTDDPIIPPARILPSHLYNQPLEFRSSSRPTRSPTTRLRTIELAGDELAVPAQDGVGQRCVCDLRQLLATQPMTNFTQSCSLCVRKPQATLELGPENPVLSGQ